MLKFLCCCFSRVSFVLCIKLVVEIVDRSDPLSSVFCELLLWSWRLTVIGPPPGFSPWATLNFRRAAPGLSRPVTFVPTERRLVVESTDRHLRRCDGRRRHNPQCVARFFCSAHPPVFRIQLQNASERPQSQQMGVVEAYVTRVLAIVTNALKLADRLSFSCQTRGSMSSAPDQMATGRVRCTSRAHPCCSVLQRARPPPQLAARLHHPP